ncbi:class I SAM-dependent methyltransferase [Fibrobacterota bacterium]
MNDLETYFLKNNENQLFKWKHFFEIYERHFSRYRGTDVHIVEFGVFQGGSLKMWRHYFGPGAKIYGVDINPECKQLEEEQIKVFIGDQEDRRFLKSLAGKIPRIDILIDDGGHMMTQQIKTFEELFYHIEEDGIYLCEDMHTSYWPQYGGGYKRKGTFVEYSKNFIDYINAWHAQGSRKLSVSGFTRSVHSLHYYDSILVIEKKPVKEPECLKTGVIKIPFSEPPPVSSRRPLIQWMKKLAVRLKGHGQP